MWKNLISLCLLTCASLVAETVDGSQKLSFELPVNWQSEPRYNLRVSIPEGYHSLQPFDEWEKAALIEFVPVSQDGDNWTEIITLLKFIDKKMGADEMAEQLKTQMLAKVEKGKVLDWKVNKEESYTKAQFFLSYVYNESNELMGALYYSGPYDCIGVQYTIRLVKESEGEALGKIREFFENNTRLE